MKVLYTIVIALLTGSVGAQFNREIGGFSSPESVVGDGSFIYVSNVGKELKPTEKDGDGFISKLSPEGEIIEKNWVPKKGELHAPKGMVITGGVLYTADIDRVVGFDIESGKQVFEMDFSSEKTSFCNALALKNEQFIFMSATDVGRIYEIDLKNGNYRKFNDLPMIRGANGLWWDSDKKALYVVGFGADNQPDGELGMIDMSSGMSLYATLSDKQGYLDGLVMDDNKLIWSDWVKFEQAGELLIMDMESRTVSKMKLPRAIGGPADFWMDVNTRTLYIPAMMEGKLLIHKLE